MDEEEPSTSRQNQPDSMWIHLKGMQHVDPIEGNSSIRITSTSRAELLSHLLALFSRCVARSVQSHQRAKCQFSHGFPRP
ncbi:unnamed protein product [Arctogadus glacialis]